MTEHKTIYLDLEYIEEHIWSKVDELIDEEEIEEEEKVVIFYNIKDADIITSFEVDYDGDNLYLQRENEESSRAVRMIASENVLEMCLLVHHTQYIDSFVMINMEFID